MSSKIIIIDNPGKRRAWELYLRRSGSEGVIVATCGQVCEFPPKLFPIGIGFGKDKIDFGRQTNPAKKQDIVSVLTSCDPDTQIYIATDKDVEGDAIALDVLNIIAETSPKMISNSFRAHPKSLTIADISFAVEKALPIKANYAKIADDAIEGRARLVTDRWIGAALSKAANMPIGRIRSTIPGMALLHQARPSSLKGPVEVGEVVLIARSAVGGLPFFVRIPFMSDDPEEKIARLTNIAKKFTKKMIPGAVMPVTSLSAAVADRFRDIRPFSTGDAVAFACRHYGLRPHQAMAGLQRAYFRGDISYPKTDSRVISPETAAKIARLGASCEIYGLSAANAVEMDRGNRTHEALHPVCEANINRVERMKRIVRKDWEGVFTKDKPVSDDDYDVIADLMTAIVARRAFEATKDMKVERGFWHPRNDLMTSKMSHEDFEVLENLEWERESGPVLPWTRHMMTGVRVWPKESVLMDMMMTEELGRPSSLPSQVKTVAETGDVNVKDSEDPFSQKNPFTLPALTEQGKENLKKMPKTIWDPATGRMIARAISNADKRSGETDKDSIDVRIRKRVLVWLDQIDASVRDTLLESVQENA